MEGMKGQERAVLCMNSLLYRKDSSPAGSVRGLRRFAGPRKANVQ